MNSVSVEKKWAAVSGDEILATAESKEKVREKIGNTKEEFEIVAIPEMDKNLYI